MNGTTVRRRTMENPTIRFLLERHQAAVNELHRFSREIESLGRINDTYVDTLDRPPTTKSFGGTIVHLATHGMHHRAQLLFMLRKLGVKDLPEGDTLSWESECETRT